MKIIPCVRSAAFVLLAAAETRAAPPPPDPVVLLSSRLYAACGMTRDALVAMLGMPSETLASDLWAYWDFNAANIANGGRFDALLVMFVDGRVSVLKLSRRPAVLALMAQRAAIRRAALIAQAEATLSHP